VAKVGMASSGGENEVVVGERFRVEVDQTLGEINPGRSGEKYRDVGLLADDRADGRSDISGRESGGRDLVEQWREEVVVATVDQGHPDGDIL